MLFWIFCVGDEHGPALAGSGQAAASARIACCSLRLVHRRIRHPRSQSGKVAARRVSIVIEFVIENGWNVSVWPLRKSGRRAAQPMTRALRAALWLLSNRANRNVESRSQGQMSTPIKIAAAAGRVSGRKRTSRRAAVGLLSITRVVAHSLE